MSKHILNIQNLCCGYPKFQLSDINMDIPKGSFAGIIGPNGSGKTTLFRAITGILGLKSGKILLSDKNLKSFSLRERAQNIAIVSQFIEAGDMSVEDYVLMGRIPYHSRFNFFESDEDVIIDEKIKTWIEEDIKKLGRAYLGYRNRIRNSCCKARRYHC